MRIIKLDEKYYCIMKQSCTIDSAKETYMSRANLVKGSFAEKYIETIFNNTFCNAINLKDEYNDFYVEEYCNFGTFLYQKELFSKQEIMELDIDADKTLLKIDMHLNSYNSSNLFEYENDFIDYFNQMLEGIDE